MDPREASTTVKASHENRQAGHDEAGGDVRNDIAIIGFSFRFPQDALSPAEFWSMLETKKSVMTAWPKDRLNLDAFFHHDQETEEKVNESE